MASVTISVLALAALIGQPVQGQDNAIDQDPCVDSEYNRFFVGMNARFPNLVKFTGKIPAPSVLYENLFNQSFTKELFKNYSEEYQKLRTGFENCKDSSYKRMSLYGFDFADFVFIQRAEDVASNLPCIQKALTSPSLACNSKCRNFEGSAAQANSAGDTYTATAKTCQYQNCTSLCGMSLIHTQCGFDAASLYRGALFKVYDVLRDNLEPADIRPQFEAGHQRSPLPTHCKRLAMMSADDSSGTSVHAGTILVALCVLVNTYVQALQKIFN